MREPRSSFRIIVSPEGSSPPFAIDAVVVEDDTFNVLSADPEARAIKGALGPLWSEASQTDPKTPGTVTVREGSPPRFLAIVHELKEEPTWREEWIASALRECLREAEARGLQAIAIPVLGSKYGSVKVPRFAELLRKALDDASLERLERLWILAPRGIDPASLEALAPYEPEMSD